MQQGLGELKKLLASTYRQEEYAYMRDETIMILTFLELNLGKDKDNELIRKRFYPVKDIEHKPLLLFSKSIFHFAAAENDSVIDLLSQSRKVVKHQPLHYLHFMEANARLYNTDFTAEALYNSYLQSYKGSTYIMSARQRIAWIHLLKGDEAGYNKNIAHCKPNSKSEELTDEDKAAIKEADSKETPNPLLLKARLLFDGGYYPRALNELAGKSLTHFQGIKAQLEFTYRLARIFDKMEKNDKAEQLYEITYKSGLHQKYYYSASAALHLAQLYEEQGNKEKAVEFYKKTLALREHDYQNSIDQKAKAGLGRLESK
ncbi:MAG: tetratricopeptide repeat protein [Bacteroidetes bacterium]|nr:tetratricopeptide repeat protein [Bacteroidota bacterium]